MVKNQLMFLMMVLVAAIPASALAGSDWKGITDDWDDIATNWSEDPDGSGWKTEKASFDPGDVAWLGGTEMPLIDATVDTQWGYARIRNGAVVTQTGGEHRWMNGTGTSNWGLSMLIEDWAPPETPEPVLHMTGGKHTADRVGLGAWNTGEGFPNGVTKGTATINIWGTGNFRIRVNPFVADLFDLDIRDGSLIDIRDDGVFEVPAIMSLLVQEYIDAGKIVAGAAGGSLVVETIDDVMLISATAPGLAGDFDGDGDVDGNDFLVWQRDMSVGSLSDWKNNFDAGGSVAAVSAAVPEPASAMLALLGLGLLAVALRRENRAI